MKVYIDADHNGFDLKNQLISYLRRTGYDVTDVGIQAFSPRDDFPEAAQRVAMAVLGSDDPKARGILICASGQGVCIGANRFKGIRASLCWDNRGAKAARNDDDCNVLCLPGKSIPYEKARTITHTWLITPFAGAVRFKRRIAQLDYLG